MDFSTEGEEQADETKKKPKLQRRWKEEMEGGALVVVEVRGVDAAEWKKASTREPKE